MGTFCCSADRTTAFLRAAYVPRYITRIALHVVSPYAFTVTAIGATDGGLCPSPDWTLTIKDVNTGDGKQILIETQNPDDIFSAIPFAAFGPILEFQFDTLVADPATLFSTFEVDNSLYASGQNFVVAGP